MQLHNLKAVRIHGWLRIQGVIKNHGVIKNPRVQLLQQQHSHTPSLNLNKIKPLFLSLFFLLFFLFFFTLKWIQRYPSFYFRSCWVP